MEKIHKRLQTTKFIKLSLKFQDENTVAPSLKKTPLRLNPFEFLTTWNT